MNPFGNIVIEVTKNDQNEQIIEGIYKRFTPHDLIIVQTLKDKAKGLSKDRELNDTVVFASFDGYNVLDLMQNDLETFNKVHEHIV